MGSTLFAAGILSELTTQKHVNAKGWGKRNSTRAHCFNHQRNWGAVGSTGAVSHRSICLALSSHASCGCIPRICCHMGRIEGNWDGNISEHQNYFCLSNICLYIKGVLSWLFVCFLVYFFSTGTNLTNLAMVWSRVQKDHGRWWITYWQYV